MGKTAYLQALGFARTDLRFFRKLESSEYHDLDRIFFELDLPTALELRNSWLRSKKQN